MNIFEQAAATANDKPKGSKAKKSDKPEIVVDDLALYADVDAVIKALEAIKEGLDGPIKAEIIANAVNTRKADSITGIGLGGKEGELARPTLATANLQLRKRDGRRGLSEAEIEILNKNKVSTQTSDTSGQFMVNPDYTNDHAIMGAVAEALSKVEGLPSDFIKATPSKTVTTDKSIAEALQVKKASVVGQLLAIVATPAIKAKVMDADIDKSLERLKGLL